jgi:ankyrin repeat protein
MSDSDSDDSDDGSDECALNRALDAGDDAAALSIVRGGADVNGEWNEWTHLCWASAWNRVAVVSCLLELGADVDKFTGTEGMTPLGVAAMHGQQEVVELLVEVGNAQLNEQNSRGMTALHCAARWNNLETAKYLVALGCSLTVQNNNGDTALASATQRNRHQLVQFLTSASDLTTNNDFSSLRSLCASFSSPFLERKIALSFGYTVMLCLKTVEKRGDAVANCTLLSRNFQHEAGLIRHILSYV